MPDEEHQAEEQSEEQSGMDAQADEAAEVAKWKAMARKHEQQAKANAAAAKRLAEIEEASKSEAERAADKVVQAEKRAAEAEAKALRYEVASARGIPAELFEFLTGDTREELEAKAEKLLSFAQGGDTQTRRPKERLRSGASSQQDDDTSSPNALINARIRRAAGR